MTTCIYDRRKKLAVADTQNTDGGGTIWRVDKVEVLPNGWLFLGSGHTYTINQCRAWAQAEWDEDERPDFTMFLEDPGEYGFGCVAVTPEGTVWMVDEEMSPMVVLDEYVAVGSGAGYALGAMDAGADAMKALKIAAARDPSTSAPYTTKEFPSG